MLKHTPVLIVIAAFNLMIGANVADAAPIATQTKFTESGQTVIRHIRNARQPVRRIISSSQSAGEKCGVWRCTWPTSGGGCLVWEKTLCKIKTIDPFE